MKNYDEIISLGTQCNPGLSLRKLNFKKETYPFDWIRSNSKIIYDVLLNGKDKYITFDSEKSDDYYTKHLDSKNFKNFPNSHINYYGQYFTHYIDISTNELINKFNKYFERFFNLLNSNKKVLFIHSHEEYLYHKNSRDNKLEFYNYLCKINDIIEEKYPNLKFEIINIDIDNIFENYKNIININIKYNLSLSDNSQTHKAKYYNPYRNSVTNIIKEYLYQN
jgi:hypothetical protein